MLVQAAVSAITNLVVLAGLPFLVYLAFQKWRRKRTFAEITRRVGLRVGPPRYLAYSVGLTIVGVASLVIWPPSLESFLRDGSPQQAFEGLGFGGTAITMALLYGIVATGFSEELLFRGLIAGSLSRRVSVLWANVLQAFIFLLPHGLILLVMPKLWPLLFIIFAGALVAGWLRIKSGSIVGPWMIHGAVNATTCLSVAARTVESAGS